MNFVRKLSKISISQSQALVTSPLQCQSTAAPRTKTISEDENYKSIYGFICANLCFSQSTTGKKKAVEKNEAGAHVTMRTSRSIYTVFLMTKVTPLGLGFPMFLPFSPPFSPFSPPPFFFFRKKLNGSRY